MTAALENTPTSHHATRKVSVNRIIFERSLADRAPSVLKIASALAFYVFFGSWIYSGFSGDLDDMLADFPQELTAMMGGGLVGATGGYVTSVMLNLLGPLVFIGLAVSWGSGAIAGEESNQTARLLFAQPVSRRRVLLNRAAVVVVGILLGVAIFAASLAMATSMFADNPPALGNVLATAAHLVFFAVAMGMIALAVGSASGSKQAGVAAGSAVTFASYLIDSFAPLTSATGLERFTPWYLYNGSQPIDNGFNLAHLALLAAVAAAGLIVGMVTVERRDLEPAAKPMLDRVPGLGSLARPRVGSVFTKTMSARTPVAVAAGVGLGAMALAMSLLFNSLADTMADLNLPQALEDALGGSSLGTAAGWMNSQVLTIVAPLAVIGLAASIGADAVAGERDRHTLLLVFSAAITRTRFLAHKLAALLTTVTVVVTLLGLGLFAGSGLADLNLSVSGIIGAAAQLGALALVFGTLAAALGTKLTRRTSLSITIGMALASFLSQALLSTVDGLAGAAKLSPWEYYIGNNPIENGLSITNLAVLLALAGTASVAAVALFNRAEVA